MESDTPLQCSGGCANCPRRKQCAAAPQPVEPTAPAAPPTTPTTPPAAPTAPSSENAALEDFLKENPSRSVLRVQAFRGNQAIPVQGVDVPSAASCGTAQIMFFTPAPLTRAVWWMPSPCLPRSGSSRWNRANPTRTPPINWWPAIRNLKRLRLRSIFFPASKRCSRFNYSCGRNEPCPRL